MRNLRSLAAAFARAWKGSARLRIVLACALVLVVAAAAVAIFRSPAARTPGRVAPVGHVVGPGGHVPLFSHVVLIVFENHEYVDIIGSRAAPNINSLASRYTLLTNYFAVTHPSLPNYLALVSGSTQGISTDCTSCRISAPNLVDSLESAHKSWKVYAQSLPNPGFAGIASGQYVRRHVPFFSFTDVLSNPSRRQRVVPLSDFSGDLSAQTLPDFSLIVPDLVHNMHSCTVATGDAWLGTFLPPLLASPALKGSVVFLVFDEGNADDKIHGGGHVAAIVAGPLARNGALAAQFLNHYSLLRTIEQSWNLPLLANSSSVASITGIWK